MTIPEFLRFTPVPLRSQHNGWSTRLQLRFILALARGAGPEEAARALGRTRQSAYRLRKRPGAESFAAAWDRAQAVARSVEGARRSAPLGLAGIETVLVPRFYRGRLIGFVQREDVAGAMRLLGRLDRLADRLEDSAGGAGRAGSYRSDWTVEAKAEGSSTLGAAALDGARGASPPCTRTREG